MQLQLSPEHSTCIAAGCEGLYWSTPSVCTFVSSETWKQYAEKVNLTWTPDPQQNKTNQEANKNS